MSDLNLDQRINIINTAYETLYKHKKLMSKMLTELCSIDGKLHFMKGLTLLDEDILFSIWNKKFIICWEFRKGDMENISEKNYYLLFTISEIKTNGEKKIFEKIDSFIITYFKEFLYKEEKNLSLEFPISFIRIFKLIFENYFINYIIKSQNKV